MTRKRVLILLGVLVLVIVLALTVRTPCGQIHYSCATAPDQGGVYYTYYEVEPLGITLLETAIGTNLGIYYSSGQDAHMAGKG